MKRHDPVTSQPFKRGDVRHDGLIFFAYTNRRKRDGYFVEIWLKPDASHRAMVNDRERHRRRTRGRSGEHAGANT